MKHKVAIGVILILLSPVVTFLMTYLFDAVRGQDGREFVVFMSALIYPVLMVAGGLYLIIENTEK